MSLIEQQGQGLGQPHLPGVETGTNLVLPPQSTQSRLEHMPEGVYDLSSESHLTRFIKVLLGATGVGRLEKAAILARLQHSMHGSHFYDLDRFYGSLFGASRRTFEAHPDDPMYALLTEEEWDEVGVKDDSFRSRMEQLARAINYGASPAGMELVAEALLSVDCDVYENFVVADRSIQTYGDLEQAGTYGDIQEIGTYGDLEAEAGADPVGSLNRTVFTVVPKRDITEEERYDLMRVLRVLKPAGSILRVRPGVPVYRSVGIKEASADSEMWRIRSRRSINGVMQEAPRAAFSSYQGEMWSHAAAVHGVAAYSLKPGSDEPYNFWNFISVSQYRNGRQVTHDGMFTRDADGNVVLLDNTNLLKRWVYSPELALILPHDANRGRIVSDGILIQTPYSGAVRGAPPLIYLNQRFYDNPFQSTPTSFAEDDVTPWGAYLDGFRLDGYIASDFYNDSKRRNILGTGRTAHRHWASHERHQEDETKEVVEFRMASPQLINYVHMDLCRVPHTATVEALDLETREWVPLRQWSINDSFPERAVNKAGDWHPLHSTDGAWYLMSSVLYPIRTDRVRVVFQRHMLGKGPVGSGNRPIPYGVGLRRFNMGYRIRSRADIPEADQSLGGGFATAVDAAGNTVVMDVVENKAENVLENPLKPWRSEPQTTNRAVTSLFLDVSTEDGEPQLVDTFRIDPAKSGPHMNIYWADKPSYGAFVSRDDLLDIGVRGGIDNTAKGAIFPDRSDPSWIEIDNRDLGLDAAAGWWIGLRIDSLDMASDTTSLRSVYSHRNAEGDYSLVLAIESIDDDDESLAFLLRVNTPDGNREAHLPISATATGPMHVSLYYSSEEERFTLAHSRGSSSSSIDLDAAATTAHTIYIGGSPASRSLGATLTGAFIKMAVQPDPVEVMAENFSSYVRKPKPGGATHEDWTANALVRFSPEFSTQDRIEFYGGAADLYGLLTWHPIERDYRLSKGYVKVPPTMARWWKFEFTDLVPELMESLVPMVRASKFFPASASDYVPPTAAPDRQWGGLSEAMTTSLSITYEDSPGWSSGMVEGTYPEWLFPRSGLFAAPGIRPFYGDFSKDLPTVEDQLPTAMKYVADSAQLARMRKLSWLYGYQPWQIGARSPRFREAGPHNYVEANLVDSNRLGYTVGINKIEAFATDYIRDDDTRVYRDHFFNDDNLEDGYTWNLNPGILSSTTDFEEVVVSKTFPSRNPVWALQFAATQTDPIQIVPDDRFRDSGRLHGYAWDSDDYWHTYGDGRLFYNPDEYTVTINRDVRVTSPGTPTIGGADYTSLAQEPLHPTFSFRVDEEEVELPSQAEGGIESPLAPTSPRGMIHAAVRATGITSTTNPLVLQVIAMDGTVLAESSEFLQQGETKEWYVSYQLGTFDRDGFQLYNARGLDEPLHPISPDEIPSLTGNVADTSPDEQVRVRLVQRGASTDSWKVDRLSLFDDAMVWDFSVDGGDTWVPGLNIRSNPNGVLRFAEPGSALKWRVTSFRPRRAITSLQIRPWYRGGVGHQVSVPHRGASVSSFEDNLPVTEDPEFKVWSLPIPRWWWQEWSRYPIMPVDGQPLTNDNSVFLARSAIDYLDAPTSNVFPGIMLVRFPSDELDGDGFPAPGTTLPAPSDQATRSISIYRGVADQMATLVDSPWLSILHDDPIIRRPLSPVTDPEVTVNDPEDDEDED